MLLAHLLHFPSQTWNQPFLQAAQVSFSEKQYFKTIVWALGMLTGIRFLGLELKHMELITKGRRKVIRVKIFLRS